jgi:3-phenylpropionate/trans-cinnamate dioxygenase ferredoxin component
VDDSWIALDTAPPAPGEMCAVHVAGRSVLLCNVAGALYAMENRCPHAGIPLVGGRLRGCILECPMHGGKLDVRDGRPAAPPIRTAAIQFAVRAADAGLEICLGA